MEKLTPQNAHQEHMVQILLAKMQGIQVEYKVDDNDWCLAGPDCFSLDIEYRIVPQPTPLPIMRKMWRMINKEWKYAAMDENGRVFFYTDEPFEEFEGFWEPSKGKVFESHFSINTDGVNWRLSLTKRPKDV